MTTEENQDQNEDQNEDNQIEEAVIAVAKKTMVGDLRDVCLQIIKDPKLTGKAWKDMNEAQQKDVVSTITHRMEDAVVQAVQVIAANGQRQVIGTLEQVTNKDGMKSVIKTSAFDDLRHELNDAVGSAVAIVLSGADEFVGVGDKPKIDKDQPDLIEEDVVVDEDGVIHEDGAVDAGVPAEEGDVEIDEDALETEPATTEGGNLEREANDYT